MLLPKIATLNDYRRMHRNEPTWLPAMRAICQRHGLDVAQLSFAPPGTHVVFRVEDRYIKLFSPLWSGDLRSERTALGRLTARPDLPVPHLVAYGEIEGWAYLVMTAVRGVPLNQAWQAMDVGSRTYIADRCGAFMAALHEVPTDGLEAIDVDWPAFVQDQVGAHVKGVRELEMGEQWARSIHAITHTLLPSSLPDVRPVLLNADLTDEHILVSERAGRWDLTGVIDFGDAMLGHPLYEFGAAGCSITRGEPSLVRAMLLGYGFSPAELGRDLSERLMAYTLVHRFISVPDLLKQFGPDSPVDLEGLRKRLWPLSEG